MIGHTVEAAGQDWQAFKNWASKADDMQINQVFKQLGGKIGSTDVGSIRKFLIGADPKTQVMITKNLGKTLNAIPGIGVAASRRMAGSGLAKGLGRIVPGLSVASNVMDVADVVTGDESLANKAMDVTAMGIGGAIGMAGGPLGASIGASTGKMISDGTQWLFGDKKSPEQRRMEEALRALQNGGLI